MCDVNAEVRSVWGAAASGKLSKKWGNALLRSPFSPLFLLQNAYAAGASPGNPPGKLHSSPEREGERRDGGKGKGDSILQLLFTI